MEHLQFKEKRIWKRIDVDNAYWYQCTDLAKDYYKEVYWITLPSFWGCAFNGYFADWKWFERIENSINWVPPQWALLFFTVPQKIKWKAINYGHVAVVDHADTNTVTVIEQNAWTGNWSWLWSDAIRIHTYNYIKPKVLWWKVLSHN